MDEFKRIDVPGGFTVNNLAAMMHIMLTAFTTTLETLAAHKGGKAGPWLDDLQEILISDAKGTVAEGMPIEADVEGVKLGIDVLQATLDAVRYTLVGKTTD
jgi:hypothetical protein